MDPINTGANYDGIAHWWQEAHAESSHGIAPLERAIVFTSNRGYALDIGCGSSGRFMEALRARGFQPEGLDVSARMVTLAKARDPETQFYHEDICAWEFPKKYEIIAAWDSTFHLPIEEQAPVLKKICEGLAPRGVLLFTCGGTDAPGEIAGSFQGQEFEYSSLGIPEYLRVLDDCGCICRHLEYDQYPEEHVYIIAQKMT
jgi:SAM-dependent methyltransferase